MKTELLSDGTSCPAAELREIFIMIMVWREVQGKKIFINMGDICTKATHFVDQYNDLTILEKRNKEIEQIKSI